MNRTNERERIKVHVMNSSGIVYGVNNSWSSWRSQVIVLLFNYFGIEYNLACPSFPLPVLHRTRDCEDNVDSTQIGSHSV